MKKLEQLKKELEKYINNEKAKFLPKFFQAYPGGYGEGDRFLGIQVPNQRKVAKKFRDLTFEEVEKLLHSEYHEHRLTAIFILIHKFKENPEKVVEIYLRNIDKINNWDLVDSSAPHILGQYLENKDRNILYEFAKSKNLWKQRIAIISTHYFIKQNDFNDAINIAEILVNHKHDLIHKAVGWTLRKIGDKNKELELQFLKKHHKVMPRTMLRYAIEKFPEEERKNLLKGVFQEKGVQK
ncbi:DNA alkylation repair protein [Thermosipho melanesiensis]|uniref:DNA alkylation repair enzyme n=2 Tax=Thermosipho melanesiensis TaxID=46541 RepID=A6LNP8_THEM4|nr:DNA alkylation repair protein [Thermosipho melanesiensis]ABR31549.1 DNA alkylation repair enzyme [Thermosipho melanesiensis BI429]APT74585.1 DNA alkylation repair protein [Thermosipho melanesiensis]OOC35290.1 DNA alkylation repair protein [Thermosipho melanesiensis]OOC35509.1 DNA alkylation repair protein [Thermosipho melanesiensis]OOC36545.1 DNA alkylation repair protein [Thermosipho melanesiensis]